MLLLVSMYWLQDEEWVGREELLVVEKFYESGYNVQLAPPIDWAGMITKWWMNEKADVKA